MKTEIPPNLSKLKNHLTGLAAVELIRLSPEYVSRFSESVLTGKLPLDHTLPSIVSTDPQFQKWRPICVDLMDVEYQIHRLSVCVSLMKLENPSLITKGEWLDNQIGYWSILTQGLIDKFEKLTKGTYRKFSTSASPERDLTEMLQTLKKYHTKLKALRDPLAHPGGPVKIVGYDEQLGMYIVFRGDIPISTIMDGVTDFYASQTSFISQFTLILLKEIDRISNYLLKMLPKITG